MTRFVVFHAPGKAWQPGIPFRQQPGLQAHVDHYRKQAELGALSGGGPFLDAASGGMMIFEPEIAEERVVEIARTDPAVESGLLTFAIRPWYNPYAPKR
jgi:uncharacterized protein YciI